jgi:hypothetical protein
LIHLETIMITTDARLKSPTHWIFREGKRSQGERWRKYALEAIIILLLSYFLFMIMFILHARIVLSGNINTCVVYEQHCVPSMPLLD